MTSFLFILDSERYTEEQALEAVEIAETGGYTEVFVPTPDGRSPLLGRIQYNPPLSTFRCGTVIIPVSIHTKIKENYHTVSKDMKLVFCDLIDTWRCELNHVAARDAGFNSEVLKRGKLVRRSLPEYEYPVSKE